MAVIIERMAGARGTAAQWTSSNPILFAGELGWESDTNRIKFGDGVTAWSSLPYYGAKFVPAYVATGTATLVAGTKAVTGLALATLNTVVRLANVTLGGTPGALYISAKSAGAGFTIASTSATDTSVVQYDVVAW